MDYAVEDVRSSEIWRDFDGGNSEKERKAESYKLQPELPVECCYNLLSLGNCKYNKVGDQTSEVQHRIC